MNQILFNTFILFSKVVTNTKQLFKTIYDTDNSVKYFVDDMCYFFSFLKTFVYGNKIEPYFTSWICVCNTTDTFALNENYNEYKPVFNTDIDYTSNIFLENALYEDINNEDYEIRKFNSRNEWYNNMFNDEFDKCMENINNFEYDDALVLIKHPENNAVISNIICYNSVKKPLIFHEPSNVKFLSIKYSHTNMKHPIFFELDRMYFIVGNEILSNTFILRLLSYQTESYVFDDSYTLEIVDNNINVKILTYNNYILLEEKDYKIKEYVYTDNDDAEIDGNTEKVNIIENDDDDIYILDHDDEPSHDIASENEENILGGDTEGMMLDIKSLANVINTYVINKNE
jgi:hypothetical protein